MVLLLPLSLAIDDSAFDNVGGSGGGVGPAAGVAAVVAAVAAVKNRDGVQERWWQGHLMAVSAFDDVQRQRRWTMALA